MGPFRPVRPIRLTKGVDQINRPNLVNNIPPIQSFFSHTMHQSVHARPYVLLRLESQHCLTGSIILYYCYYLAQHWISQQ